jgi:hypothetical protein
MNEETTTTEVTTDAANVSGEAESAGTQDQAVTGGETTSTEGENPTEGTETAETGETAANAPDSLPANERIQQLIAKDRDREAKINELQSKLVQIEQRTTQPQVDFVDIDFDKVNAHLQAKMDQIEELKLDGRVLEAMELQDGIAEFRQDIKANEQRKQAFLQQMQQTQQGQQVAAQLNQRIIEASDIVRKDAGITPEVWKEGETFFAAERQKNPLLDAQYREQVMLQGPIAGLLFAKDHVMKNMGQKQAAATQQKNDAKGNIPGGKTATTTAPREDFKTMSDDDFTLVLNKIKFGT